MTPKQKSHLPLAATPAQGYEASWIGYCLLIVAVFVAYSNTLHAPFEFDDYGAIINNSSLRDFWALRWLHPTAGGGSTASGRPVLAFTLALNYAWGGLNPVGYHILNIAIHALAALVLFGIVRRTLARVVSGISETQVNLMGLAATALWALHPLQTEAVTYIVQRAESLMALFYLLTFYCFLRSLDSPRRKSWQAGAILACLAGMGTKEVMVSAPVMLLLFDRAYIETSFRKIWRERRGLYIGLGATWIFLVYLVLSLGGNRGGSTGGLSVQAAAAPYWLTQFVAFVTYIKLIFWPSPLVFEYGPDVYNGIAPVIASAVVVIALFGASIVACLRWPKLGFLGLFFFAILAPTSIIPGTLQAIVEHRLYLALAPVAVLVILPLWRYLESRATYPLLAIVAVLGVATFQRNATYRSAVDLWRDTALKRPGNSRAHHNYAEALAGAGQTNDAIAEYRRAIEIQPDHAFAQEGLGRLLLERGRPDEAAQHFRAALQADPSLAVARVNLGRALTQLGDADGAMKEYQAVLATEPEAIDARVNLSALLIANGRVAKGEAMLRAVLTAQPELAEAHYHLGIALEKDGDVSSAEKEFAEALRLKPGFAPAHLAQGNVLARRGDMTGAIHSYEEAIHLDPRSGDARYALGNLFAKARDFERAIQQYEEALRLDSSLVEARNNLANCQLVTGNFAKAIENYRAVLRARPGDEAVRKNLELAEEMLRQAPTGTR